MLLGLSYALHKTPLLHNESAISQNIQFKHHYHRLPLANALLTDSQPSNVGNPENNNLTSHFLPPPTSSNPDANLPWCGS